MLETTHAEVVGPIEKQWCRVRFEDEPEGPEAWVRLAVPAPYAPARGDLLLVVRAPACAYAIGVLEAAAPETRPEEGASVFREGGPGALRLGVRDASGHVLFAYEPARGRAVLSVPEGDLELRAGRHLDLVSGGQVRLFAAAGVELESGGAVALTAGLQAPARLRLDEGRASLRAERVELDARDGQLRAERLRAEVADADVEAGQLRLAVRRLVTVAEEIVQRARSFQRRVEGLYESSAGRARQLVEGAHQLRAGRLDLRGRKGVKIDGDKIHLG